MKMVCLAFKQPPKSLFEHPELLSDSNSGFFYSQWANSVWVVLCEQPTVGKVDHMTPAHRSRMLTTEGRKESANLCIRIFVAYIQICQIVDSLSRSKKSKGLTIISRPRLVMCVYICVVSELLYRFRKGLGFRPSSLSE